jgi:hypothetical protein
MSINDTPAPDPEIKVLFDQQKSNNARIAALRFSQSFGPLTPDEQSEIDILSSNWCLVGPEDGSGGILLAPPTAESVESWEKQTKQSPSIDDFPVEQDYTPAISPSDQPGIILASPGVTVIPHQMVEDVAARGTIPLGNDLHKKVVNIKPLHRGD